MSNWKDKLNLFSRKSTARTIGGQEWNFYPVSVSAMFQMRSTILPVVEAFSVLFARNNSDVKQQIEEIKSVSEGTITRTEIDGIELTLAQFRAKQRREALEKAVNAILDETSKLAVGRLLVDSLRDDFPARPVPEAEVKGFVESLDMAQLVEFLMGFAAANAEVFGPLGRGAVQAAQSKLKKAIEEQAAADAAGEVRPAAGA